MWAWEIRLRPRFALDPDADNPVSDGFARAMKHMANTAATAAKNAIVGKKKSELDLEPIVPCSWTLSTWPFVLVRVQFVCTGLLGMS